MANFLEGSVKIDTSSMTTEELKKYRDNLQQIVDYITHELRARKIYEHKHAST